MGLAGLARTASKISENKVTLLPLISMILSLVRNPASAAAEPGMTPPTTDGGGPSNGCGTPAVCKENSEYDGREDVVDRRTGKDDGRALAPVPYDGKIPPSLRASSPAQYRLPSTWVSPSAEHLYISPERERANLPSSEVFVGPTLNLRAKANREDFHPNAISPGNPVVAPFVDKQPILQSQR